MTQKIRVLHIIKNLNLGGAETNLYNLVKAIDSEKFESHVAYSYGGEIERRFQDGQVKLFKYAEGDHKIRSLETFPIIFRLISYIRKNRIQVVHTHIFNAHFWGLAAAKVTGCKIVEHVHDFRYLDSSEVRKRKGAGGQYKFINYVKGLSDFVIVLTRQNVQYLIERKFYPESRVRQIYNGIPMPKGAVLDGKARAALKAGFGFKENAAVIFVSSRFVEPKNLGLVVRIAPRVVQAVPEAAFVIAGDGPLLDELKQEAGRKKLDDSVKFIGFQADIMKILSFSDIFLLPSFLELHSIAILEAMSMKVPVVISKDVGSHNEFIHDGVNGVLLDPFVDAHWPEAIIRLLQDHGLRARVGQKGYETCLGRFDVKDAARKIEELYVELLNK